MSESKTLMKDLTTGSIMKKLLFVAVPIMGTQLMQMLYNLVDMFWLGRIGNGAVAASGTAGMYLWLSQAFMMVGRVGAEIGVSQSIGRKDIDEAKKYSQTAFQMAVILGVLFGLFMILLRDPLIGFFQIKEAAVAQDAMNYLAITGLAIPATYITSSLSGTFTASGNSRTPFYINAVGLVTNMILDPILIFTVGLNVMGAAIATSIAQILAAVLFLAAVQKSKTRPFAKHEFPLKIEKERALRIFKWSIPVVLESMLFTVLSMVIAKIVAGFGVTAMAVQRVGSQIESLSWLIGGGFASAVTAFMGQNFGGGKYRRVHRGVRISTVAMFVWGIIVTLILFFGGKLIFQLFLAEPSAIEMGIVYMKVLAFCQIIACLEYNCAGAFRGIGRTIPPSVVSITGNMIRVPIVYLLAGTALGINGVWVGITIGASIRSIWLIIWFIISVGKMPQEDINIGEQT